MSLENRYNIPKETVKEMVQDGVISCSVARHFEIYDHFLNYRSSHPGKSMYDCFFEVAQQLKVSESTVKQVVYKLDKKS